MPPVWPPAAGAPSRCRCTSTSRSTTSPPPPPRRGRRRPALGGYVRAARGGARLRRPGRPPVLPVGAHLNPDGGRPPVAYLGARRDPALPGAHRPPAAPGRRRRPSPRCSPPPSRSTTPGSTPTPRTSPSGGSTTGVDLAARRPGGRARRAATRRRTRPPSRRPTFRDAFGVYLEGRVRPDRRGRGIGRALLAWQLDRGAEIHAERHPEAPRPADRRRCTPTMPSLEALLRRAGLEQLRWFLHMERPLTDAAGRAAGRRRRRSCRSPGTGTTRCGGRTTPRSPSTTAPASGTRTSWQVMFTGQRAFRPDLSVLALADGVGHRVRAGLRVRGRHRGHRRPDRLLRPDRRRCRRPAGRGWRRP